MAFSSYFALTISSRFVEMNSSKYSPRGPRVFLSSKSIPTSRPISESRSISAVAPTVDNPGGDQAFRVADCERDFLPGSANEGSVSDPTIDCHGLFAVLAGCLFVAESELTAMGIGRRKQFEQVLLNQGADAAK